MYRIESTIVEELKEKGLNATDLLQAHAKNNKEQTKTIKITYHYYIDNETQEKLIEAGIDDMEELKAALLKCFGDVDVTIEKNRDEQDNWMDRR